MQTSTWETHDWFDRPLEIDPSQKVTQFVCRKCGRGFIGDDMGKRYAIHASAFVVKRLSDEVTERWLAEPCPEHLRTTDRNDGKTRFQDRN
jgi:hypothetical protein